jgi:hypothetical protein
MGGRLGRRISADDTTVAASLPSTPFSTAQVVQAGTGVHNVWTYGAAGDGLTDDTTAIRAAADAAVGNVLYFPAGTYIVDNFDIGSGTTVQGAGPGATILKVTRVTGSTYLGVIHNSYQTTGNTDLTVRDLTIWRTVEVGPSAFDEHIYFKKCSRILVENCRFLGTITEATHAGKGVHLQGCDHATVQGNHFQDLPDNSLAFNRLDGDATKDTGKHIALGNKFTRTLNTDQFSHLIFTQNQCAAIGNISTGTSTTTGSFLEVGPPWAGNTTGLLVSGNSVDKLAYGVLISQTTGAKILDNDLHDANIVAVLVGGAGNNHTDLLIRGNTLDGGYIKVENTDRFEISGNISRSSPDVGITAATAVTFPTVVDNQVYLADSGGIVVYTTTSALVSRNMVLNSGQGHAADADASPGISVQATDGMMSHNVAIDTQAGGSKTQAYGVFSAYATRLAMIGNISTGNATGPYRVVGNDPLYRSGNVFDGVVDRVSVGVVATGSLPAAAAAMDGTILIEDAGAGDRNLIIYAGGQRFRIDGGANV